MDQEFSAPEQSPMPEDRWVARGRSPIAAGVIALLGIGAFYFFAQVVFVIVGILAGVHDLGALEKLRDSMAAGSDSMGALVGPLRWALLLSQYLALLLPAILVIRAWHSHRIASYVRFKPVAISHVALAVVGTMLIIPIGVMLGNLMRGPSQESSDIEKLTEQLFTAHSNPEFFFLLFVVAVTPAICEEFFFRGYVQRTFERAMGGRSVVLVGVIFGLFHMQPAGLLTLSLIGVWLGFVYYRSRSLLPNMAAHFTNNALALWIAYQAPVVFGVNLQDDAQFPMQWALAAVPLLMLVIWTYLRVTAAPATQQS